MALTFQFDNAAPAGVKADLLVIPAFAGRDLGPKLDAHGPALADLVAATGFEAKEGEALAVPATKVAAKAALLVGLGDPKALTVDGIRRAGALVARRSAKATVVATALLSALPRGLDRPAAAQAFAEGVSLGTYRFLRYKQKGEPAPLATVVILGRRQAKMAAALERGVTVAGAVAWARDLVNEPAGTLTPSVLAEQARRAAEVGGLDIEVLDEVAIANEGLGGLLGVSLGSDEPPRLILLTYEPEGTPTGTVAVVGKGITFDSGGLSLKTSEGMQTMKTDMSGAAAVIGAMSVLRAAGTTARVLGIVPTTENMPGGRAIKPGDVLKIRNGKTVEVLNTDAEGRLILADGLSLAVERKPDAIVDLATLTGACMVALGLKIAGMMGNDEAWTGQVRQAADRAGERLWPLPLPEEYRKDLESEVADLKNIGGGRHGGALTAALFLSEFVDGIPWAHLDIAGPARAQAEDGYTAKGGTGFGVRTLVELLSTFEKPSTPRRGK
ncbi:MAG: leucyl aminopeptidase [Acidimicrobiia bacterium]